MTYHLTSADLAAPVLLPRGAPDAAPWRRVQLPAAAGCCATDATTLDADGLHLVYSRYAPACDVLESSTLERERAALTITVALQGCSSTLAGGQRYDFVAGHSTLAAFSSVRGRRRFPARGPIRQLRVVAEEALLHKYALAQVLDGGKSADKNARHLFFGPHLPAVQRLAETLVHLHGSAGSVLDLQIAALSLLAEQTRAVLPAPRPLRDAPIRAPLQEKMQRVRQLLQQQFARPLTLAYLCAQVGTNECSLKQGFRACFGTSVHGMLTDIRMHQARELLEGGLPAASVAQRVGYRHAASFSSAFARYWGRTPKVFFIKK